MTTEEYRTSKCQAELAAFLGTVAGRELIAILRRDAEPSMEAKKVYGTHEDVKMQMSLNLVDSLAKNSVIKKIEAMATPMKKPNAPRYEDLEPDDLPVVRKAKEEKKHKS